MSATVIGVDVGGTKIAVATLHDGELSPSQVQASSHDDATHLVDQLVTAVSEQAAAAPGSVAAVGIGVPSVIDFAAGRVRSTVNLPLSDFPLRDVLQERLSLPVFVDNDANCAALAEAHDEEGNLDVQHLVMFTVGTGVGGGIIIGGRIYRGATGAAGEVGHQLIGLDLDRSVPPAGSFPQRGSLEFLAAGRALDRLAHRTATESPDSELGHLEADGATVAGPEAVQAARDGDAAAIAAITLLGQRLGIGIANAINVFDPEVVALGGGVSTAGALLIDCAREVASQYTLPGRRDPHGDPPGPLGAAGGRARRRAAGRPGARARGGAGLRRSGGPVRRRRWPRSERAAGTGGRDRDALSHLRCEQRIHRRAAAPCHPSRPLEGDRLMQIGFVGLGKMGGNMVHRIRRDSDHEVVAFDFNAGAVKQAVGNGATGREIARRAGQEARPAADGVDHGAGRRRDRGDGGQAVQAAGPRRHDRRRRQLPAGPTTSAAAAMLRKLGINYVDVGTSGGVWGLEVGYCMMVGGANKAVKRLAPILDVLAPPTNELSRAAIGPYGWQHFGPSGAGHYVKMVHNGVEYGLMQAYAEGFDLFDKCEYELDNAKIAHLWGQGSVVRSWLCELAARAFEQDGNELRGDRGIHR